MSDSENADEDPLAGLIEKAGETIDKNRGVIDDADEKASSDPVAAFRSRLSEKGLVEEKAGWIPYQGPQGGTGWKNTDTGEVSYSDEAPGEALDADDIGGDADLGEGAMEDPEGAIIDAGKTVEALGGDPEEFGQALQDLVGFEDEERVMEEVRENPDILNEAALDSVGQTPDEVASDLGSEGLGPMEGQEPGSGPTKSPEEQDPFGDAGRDAFRLDGDEDTGSGADEDVREVGTETLVDSAVFRNVDDVTGSEERTIDAAEAMAEVAGPDGNINRQDAYESLTDSGFAPDESEEILQEIYALSDNINVVGTPHSSNKAEDPSEKAERFIDRQRGGSGKADGGEAELAEKATDAFRDALGFKGSWIPYSGPRGGSGWLNTDSGKVSYSNDAPGETMDFSELEPDDVADLGEQELGQLVQAAAWQTDDPEGFMEDLAEAYGMDPRDEGVVEAIRDDPSKIGEALGPDDDSDGEDAQFGGLSPGASQALAEASDEEVRDAIDHLLGGDWSDVSGDELREEFASTPGPTETEILDALGSDVEAEPPSTDAINAGADAVTDAVNGNTDEVTYDTVSEVLSSDSFDGPVDGDLVDEVAEVFGVGRDGGDGGGGGDVPDS